MIALSRLHLELSRAPAFEKFANKIFVPKKDKMVCLIEESEKELLKYFYVVPMDQVTRYNATFNRLN